VSPDIEEGLLGRVLGEMSVAKDAVGDPEQAGMVSRREHLECSLVTVLCLHHEVLVHGLSLICRRSCERREGRLDSTLC
jgi:hypothetical protein